MHAFMLFIAYLICVYLIAALMEYPIYLLINNYIAIPFSSISGHLVVPIALAGFYPFLYYLGLNNKQAVGFGLQKYRLIAHILGGLLLGILIMTPLLAILFALDIRVPAPDFTKPWTFWIGLVLKGLLTGILVGLIEETFFRGALFTAIVQSNNLRMTVFLSSLLYAVVHFIDSQYHIPPDQLNWFSGLVILSKSFEQFTKLDTIIDSLLALFFVGVFLALVRAKSGTISFCIGLHAGWVLSIKIVKKFSRANPDAPLTVLTGNYDGIIGYLAFAWLAVLSAVFYYFFFVLNQNNIGNYSGPHKLDQWLR